MSSKPIRLQNLPKLKVKKPVLQKQTNSCIVIMSSLLNCWSSNGEGNATCLTFEKDLKTCMNERKFEKDKVSSINYHASRLYPRISGNTKD
ncbi:mitochondrial 37S ribosomal protein YmS-T [Saccharomycopsis crataegensis]|uniref:Small ribosomal subunit protein mS37 n=1 Tax=Saccharomycopsis crataegensis TaxID=43959 RepID=A0AAV5QPK4_9ASCO|nr:mitochondrial 37S ribosomal protein YmS-T [Saccharomycopsis crataegensis]